MAGIELKPSRQFNAPTDGPGLGYAEDERLLGLAAAWARL
jgi:hypothetical protein